uniref:Uncharacterized protein n=1 Tax=Chelonoidis abingdonii TaxID=106734 RepID=A0A8C0H2L0_CHEAB
MGTSLPPSLHLHHAKTSPFCSAGVFLHSGLLHCSVPCGNLSPPCVPVNSGRLCSSQEGQCLCFNGTILVYIKTHWHCNVNTVTPHLTLSRLTLFCCCKICGHSEQLRKGVPQP